MWLPASVRSEFAPSNSSRSTRITTSAIQRAEWGRTIAHHFDTIDFHLDSDTLREVRKRLHELPSYTAVATGLREPLSSDGVLLLEALRERR